MVGNFTQRVTPQIWGDKAADSIAPAGAWDTSQGCCHKFIRAMIRGNPGLSKVHETSLFGSSHRRDNGV
ncbi:hypothetical protein GCM10022290_19390 [Sagittula marina]